MTNLADDLRKAACRIEQQGLAKHVYHEGDDVTTKHCTLGAVYPDLEGPMIDLLASRGPVGELLAEVIREQYPDRRKRLFAGSEADDRDNMLTIIAFNDHQDTAPEDVILVLEKAATLAEERG